MTESAPADDAPAVDVADPGTAIGKDGSARPGWASVDPLLREYYDTEWGTPVRDERRM